MVVAGASAGADGAAGREARVASDDRAESGPRSRRSGCCLFGCLGLGLLGVALVLGGGAWIGSMMSGFDEAEQFRQEREAAAAGRPFVPPPDGRIPPARLDAFLRVRERLADPCSRFAAIFGTFEDLDERGRRGEDPAAREVLGVFGTAFQLPGALSDYFEARNRGLVEEEMSLDEWRWYVALAYRTGGGAYRAEGVRPNRAAASFPGGQGELVRRALQRQLEAARAAGPEVVGADWLEQLEAEAARLDEAPRAWAWGEGLPERVRASLEPRADDLRRLHCPHAEDMELDDVERKGMSVQVR
jgi:hypothetical protein